MLVTSHNWAEMEREIVTNARFAIQSRAAPKSSELFKFSFVRLPRCLVALLPHEAETRAKRRHCDQTVTLPATTVTTGVVASQSISDPFTKISIFLNLRFFSSPPAPHPPTIRIHPPRTSVTMRDRVIEFIARYLGPAGSVNFDGTNMAQPHSAYSG